MSIISNVMLTVTEAFKSAYPDAAMGILVMREVANPAHQEGDTLRAPLRLDVARGDERYVMLNGQEQTLKAGDMFMADAEGVTSSVIYGPANRTRLTPDTRRVLFAVYAPPGIEHATVHQHLEDIQANVRVIAPGAAVELLKVYVAE